MKVLIVEDDSKLLRLLTEVLKKYSDDVTTCTNAEKALEYYQKNFYPLIITDINLSAMDGLELCRKIRSSPNGKYSTILVETGVVPTEKLSEVLKAGADDYIYKPIDIKLLNVRLQVALKHAQDKIIRREDEKQILLLSKAVEQSPTQVVITDVEGNIKYVNPKFTQLTQYSQEEVLGQNPRVLKSDLQPESFYKDMWNKICAGEEWRGDFCNKRKDGEIFWEAASISPVRDEDGKINHFVKVGEDVTHRRTSEEKLRKAHEQLRGVFDTIPGYINVIDTNFNIIDHSDNFPNLEEMEDHVSFIGKKCYEVLMCRHKKCDECLAISALEKKELMSRIWIPGNDFCSWGSGAFKIYYNPITNEDGTVWGIIEAFMDIEDLKKVEQELKESQKKLQIANAAKDKFFSIIGHDLRNPFQGILTTADFLEESLDELDKTEVKEYLNLISNAAISSNKLLEDLLQWAKSQTGKQKIKLERVNVKKLLCDIADTFKQNAQSKKIDLILEIEKTIEIDIDINMIQTVLRNLLSNAIKFTPPNGMITVSSYKTEKFTEISVMDTGVGIKAENLKKIFGIDTHYSTKGTDGEPGSGLGLILCKEFIEKHGGEILAESSLGKGSIFKITLPNQI